MTYYGVGVIKPSSIRQSIICWICFGELFSNGSSKRVLISCSVTGFNTVLSIAKHRSAMLRTWNSWNIGSVSKKSLRESTNVGSKVPPSSCPKKQSVHSFGGGGGRPKHSPGPASTSTWVGSPFALNVTLKIVSSMKFSADEPWLITRILITGLSRWAAPGWEINLKWSL